jgi:lactate dehydrogenase-like 2-hydroxyacid dehydrogenase
MLSRIHDAGYELVFPSPGAQPSEIELQAVLGDAVGYVASVERVLATPHIGGFTEERINRATTAAVANLLESLAKSR